MRKKSSFLLFIFILSSVMLFAQNKNAKPEKGNCKEVIYSLQQLYKNDSVAFQVFKDYYEITNISQEDRNTLLKKNYAEAIRYFTSEKGEKYLCNLTIIEIDPCDRKSNYLLLDHPSKPEN